MKELNNGIKIIGLDHGYGNIKTANGIFPASVDAHDVEPVNTNDLLVYNGKYYTIGSGHRVFTLDKVSNEDHYILTLAGIAQELWYNKLTSAKVHIAAGLPLNWVVSQREAFRKYLLQNEHVEYTWRGIDYSVDIVGADVYPQGFSAILPEIKKFTGSNMLCDIGNGTMNVMIINDRKPVEGRFFTEKLGTHECLKEAHEALLARFGNEGQDFITEQIMRTGTAEGVSPEYIEVVSGVTEAYVVKVMDTLKEHEYDPNIMRLWVVGGGGCLLEHFGHFDMNRVKINHDIHATAKGYEYVAERKLNSEAKSR